MEDILLGKIFIGTLDLLKIKNWTNKNTYSIISFKNNYGRDKIKYEIQDNNFKICNPLN